MKRTFTILNIRDIFTLSFTVLSVAQNTTSFGPPGYGETPKDQCWFDIEGLIEWRDKASGEVTIIINTSLKADWDSLGVIQDGMPMAFGLYQAWGSKENPFSTKRAYSWDYLYGLGPNWHHELQAEVEGPFKPGWTYMILIVRGIDATTGQYIEHYERKKVNLRPIR